MPTTFKDQAVREDLVFLRRIRQPEYGVLVDLAPEETKKVVTDKGSVIIPCADGDQIYDLLSHHHIVCGCGLCHHAPALNGGPLLLSDKVSEELQADGEVLLRHAFEGKSLKGVETMVLYGHSPCGKARGNNLTSAEAIMHYVRAKDRVKDYARRLGVDLKACHLWMHIHWPTQQRRSYFLNRRAWETNACVLEFRQKWEKASFRQDFTQKHWDEYFPTLMAA